MAKIAIVSSYYLETSFPLSKYIANEGNEVELYSTIISNYPNAYVIDYKQLNPRPGLWLNKDKLLKVIPNRLSNYISGFDYNVIFYMSGRKGVLFDWINAFTFAKHLKRKRYDKIHFIGESFFFVQVNMFLEKQNRIHSLHEITSHDQAKTPLLNRVLLNYLNKKGINIITHSVVSQVRLQEYYNNTLKKRNQKSLIEHIPYDIFETYKCFMDRNIEEQENTILFIGRINKSKGINYLVEAIRMLQNKNVGVKLIIAGKGDIYFTYADLDNCEVINYELSNENIVELIRSSTVLICPYISASQSGIPMTAFVFDKPVIATNVGALSEVIEEGKTGLIVEPRNSQALANAIETIIKNKYLLNKMRDNIHNKYNKVETNWIEIAKRTIVFYHISI